MLQEAFWIRKEISLSYFVIANRINPHVRLGRWWRKVFGWILNVIKLGGFKM